MSHEQEPIQEVVSPTASSEAVPAASEPEQAGPQQDGHVQDVAMVTDPTLGWDIEVAAHWWYRQLPQTPLSKTCTIELLPTQYGRWVLWLTPHDPARSAWIWTSGEDSSPYLKRMHARRREQHARQHRHAL